MRTFSVPEQILRPLFIFFLVCFLFGFLLAYILYLLGLTSATNSSHIAVFSIEISFFFLLLISFLQSKYETAEPGSLKEHRSFSVRVGPLVASVQYLDTICLGVWLVHL